MIDAGVSGRRETAMSEYIGNRIVPKHCGVWDSTKGYEGLSIVLEETTGDSYISRKDVPAGTGLNQTEYWSLCSRFSEQMALLRKETAGQVAEMEGRTSAAEELTNSNKATLEERMENIEARQDANVTASTDRNANYAAELVDARVDIYNHTFGSAGGSLRSVQNRADMLDLCAAWGWQVGFINQYGTISASNEWRCVYRIPICADIVYITGQFSLMNGNDEYGNVVCYDKDKNYLGVAFRSDATATYRDHEEVKLLDGTAYISITTGVAKVDTVKVFTRKNFLPELLAADIGTAWQWMNGKVEISWEKREVETESTDDSEKPETATYVTVKFLNTGNHLCHKAGGGTYAQERVEGDTIVDVQFTPYQWWAVVYAGGEVKVVETNTAFSRLFDQNRVVIALFYGTLPVYAIPSNNGTIINGVDYGNPARVANTSEKYSKYLGQNLYLAEGAFTLDMEARTIQVTGKLLAVGNTTTYFWIPVNEEPIPLLESSEATLGHMLILGYDDSTKTMNLYNAAQFKALGINGYYIASLYMNKLWYPHMNPSLPITYNGTVYKAGELFREQTTDTFIPARFQNKFNTLEDTLLRLSTHALYIGQGAFSIDKENNTIQVTKKLLGVADNYTFYWIEPNEEPIPLEYNYAENANMRILGYDNTTKTINFYTSAQFRALKENGYYIASFYLNKLWYPHINPSVAITFNGTEYQAGELFMNDTTDTYVEKKYRDYIDNVMESGNDGDELGDIVSPSHWDCMEGRQMSIFYDCLSRHEGRENLYRVTNSKNLTRNEYCLNYTPTAEDADFNVNVIRLNKETMLAAETKAVAVRVHHPLSKSLTKNVCICGDSLVDNNYVASEVYRMLTEDGDCVINQLGVRGPAGGKHEGRGSWKWATYLQGTDYASKSNAFWDADKGRLDFQKYCETNGYEDIDYFLIALGTNDVSQGSSLYRTEAQVQKFVDQARQFVDALLSEETGFPNCKIGIGLCGPGSDYSYLASSSMGIFRKSINTLNLALIKAFDAGAYHPNVTCFAHGLRTNRRLAFPYSDKAVTDRFTETSRTLTNSIHPSARGYQAWADGYYCQIRAWLEEDAAQ